MKEAKIRSIHSFFKEELERENSFQGKYMNYNSVGYIDLGKVKLLSWEEMKREGPVAFANSL